MHVLKAQRTIPRMQGAEKQTLVLYHYQKMQLIDLHYINLEMDMMIFRLFFLLSSLQPNPPPSIYRMEVKCLQPLAIKLPKCGTSTVTRQFKLHRYDFQACCLYPDVLKHIFKEKQTLRVNKQIEHKNSKRLMLAQTLPLKWGWGKQQAQTVRFSQNVCVLCQWFSYWLLDSLLKGVFLCSVPELPFATQPSHW